jgi:hypothetical protein
MTDSVTSLLLWSSSRFVQVIEENIGIVLFDPHGSLGQDEDYLQNWFTQQYDDYLELAR